MNKFPKISDTKNHKLLIIFIISLFIVSCSDPEVSLEKITISGDISIAETIEMNQPINLTIFHAISGIGFQEHPLYEIESFTSDQLTFQHTFDYDAKGNRGLLVYAWIDLDGDGLGLGDSFELCNGLNVSDFATNGDDLDDNCASNIHDECDVCDGDNSSCADCAGTPNGDAYVDECGDCD